jgi:hypothetical protein
VERTRNLEWDDAGAADRFCLQRCQRIGCTGDDDLAAAVEVGGLEAELGEASEECALIPVGVSAAAAAIATLRSRTKAIASVSVRMPEAAAAVISPTE